MMDCKICFELFSEFKKYLNIQYIISIYYVFNNFTSPMFRYEYEYLSHEYYLNCFYVPLLLDTTLNM